MILVRMQSSLNKDHHYLKWQPQKSWTLYQGFQDVRGQAADAVSAYTQVKMEDASTSLKIPQSECPDIWIRLPKHKRPKSWSSMEDPVVPLERKYVRSSSGRTIMGKAIWKSSIGTRLEKVQNWECLFVNRARGLFLSVYGQDRKHRIDLDNPHERRRSGRTNIISWHHVYLGYASVKSVMKLWQTTEICWNPGFLLVQRKNYLSELQGNLMHKQYLLGPVTWKVTQRICVERYCEFANKTTQQLYKICNSTHGWPSI